MTRSKRILSVGFLAFMALGLADAQAKKSSTPKGPPQAQLSETGKQLEAKYAALLSALQTEIKNDLPAVPQQKVAALQKAHAQVIALQEKADSAGKSAGETKVFHDQIANWKRYRVGAAASSIKKANADLSHATTDAQREELKKEIAKWEQSKADYEKLIRDTEAKLAQAKATEPELAKANETAQAELTKAQAAESSAAHDLLADIDTVLSSDKRDAKLIKCVVLTEATANGLAAFAQQDKEHEALIEKLLSDDGLMREMLIAGGAEHGKFGSAMQIYTDIRKASSKSADGALHRLALATALELASPVVENSDKSKAKNPDDPDAAVSKNAVDPVKRYLHYEDAYLKGQLDPAFKDFTVWEYRMVVEGVATNEELTWGREMIRNYRPDYVTSPKYGWRYSALVKSDVKYGSEDCKNDRADLSQWQNILKDGGVCGRRAFFGRFILRANGIPVWGVTQHKHAALSHWTPEGWLINLGAGFNFSWWDKGDVSMNGADFLLETQARKHAKEYVKVLRAQWVSRILGEEAYNGRRNVAGGTWSNLAHYQAIILASKEVELGPLGEELAEANLPAGADEAQQETVTKEDQKISVGHDGIITIPVVAHGKSTGSGTAMKSFGGGMQLLGSAGFKTQYEFEAPRAGKYTLTARVVTVQENRALAFAANDGKAVEVPAPYTAGMWQPTQPVEVALNKGHNVLRFEIRGGGRLAIKDFTLKPVN